MTVRGYAVGYSASAVVAAMGMMMMNRKCGECTLCCRLMPIQDGEDHKLLSNPLAMIIANPPKDMILDFHKPAGLKCPHQCHHGCKIYDKRPMGCRMWSCRWLVNDDTNDMRRPDRVGYVVDMVPDMIRVNPNDGTSDLIPVPVIQVWVDRKKPWRDDPELWKFLERRSLEGYWAIMRYSSMEASIFVPPVASPTGKWYEVAKHKLILQEKKNVRTK